MKKRFTTELILVAPDLDKKMRIEIDASDYMMGKVLREVTVKIGLKQEEEEEEIVMEALLDSGATELVMSEEFARRHKFRRTKLERPVYVRNVDGMLNYVGPIMDTVEVEIFFKGHKKRTAIDVIGR